MAAGCVLAISLTDWGP